MAILEQTDISLFSAGNLFGSVASQFQLLLHLFCKQIREVVKKKRIFYGQADRKG